MIIDRLFPIPVGVCELGRDITTEELDCIKSLDKQTNQVNEMSSSNYILNHCKELKSIKKFIENCLN